LGLPFAFASGTAFADDPPIATPQVATAPLPVVSVKADDTAASTSVARALQSSFIHVSQIAGPATVRILSFAAPVQATEGDGENGMGFDDPGMDWFHPRAGGRSGHRGERALGSGVLIRPEGYILTNDHVVEDSPGGKVMVTLSDNRTFVGTVIRDMISDLAIVKIDAGAPLPFVHLADSQQVQVGQWAIAIGSPFDQANTMTTGIVSALHRNRDIADGASVGVRYYNDLIQTDAAINPGNSGGPLLDIDGNLIGINVAIMSPSNTSSGIGFAIPSNAAHAIAEQLINKGKATHASLGILPEDIPYFLRSRLGTEHGAYVTQVPYDSAGDRAGLEPGDVIVRFGTTDVADETVLRTAIGQAEPNTSIPITVVRAGKTQTLTATLTDRTAGGSSDSQENTRISPVMSTGAHHLAAIDLGIVARPLSAQTVSDLRLKAGTKGVWVYRVIGGSPAGDSDLERGSVVSAVNGSPVLTVDALNETLAKFKSGDVVTLSVYVPAGRTIAAARGVVDVLIP
jgi:serine protease Do